MDEVELRNRQALGKGGAVDALAPGLVQLSTARQEVEDVHRALADLWQDGQAHRWDSGQ
jgi:hypothetical protein